MTESNSQCDTPCRVLLVDDNEPFRERLARALEHRGYRVTTAADYDQAMQAAREERPQRAIVDLKMPGRSGLDLVRDLKELDAQVEVLVLSGYGSIATAVDAIKLGAVNFVPKPADADEVLAAFTHQTRSSAQDDGGPASHAAPSLARVEWEHIHRVLTECEGNVSEAARRLGIHRRSLQRKLRKRAPE